MKTKKLRTIIPLAILALAGIGFVAHTGFGNLSAIGWDSVSLLCPLGALGTMLASKTLVPRAVVSLAIAVVGIVLLGRAFCAWACPVPLWGKLRTAFSKRPAEKDGTREKTDGSPLDSANAEGTAAIAAESSTTSAAMPGVAEKQPAAPQELSNNEKRLLKQACEHKGCASACQSANQPANSRHMVLGGALLSAAIFGFPVFCLICPIGLSFALVFVLINLFGAGDVTWSVVVIPALLLVEVVFFRKWCSHLCPLSALMSLVGKLNRTFRPTVNEDRCIETRGGTCGQCATTCEVGIDPRHPERGASWSECTKCRECALACPGEAISLPLLAKHSQQERGKDESAMAND